MHWVRLLITIIILIVLIGIVCWISSQNNYYRKRRRNKSSYNGMQSSDSSDGIVALLELTGDGSIIINRAAAEALRIEHPEVEIIDTESNLERTLELMEQKYNEGVRKFIGASRSTVVDFVKDFVQARPDMALVSIGSTATPLAIDDNIFRLVEPDTNLEVILPRFFSIDAVASDDGAFELVDRDKLGDMEYIHFISQQGDEWAESNTENLTPLFEQRGINTGVSFIDLGQSPEQIGATLESTIPDLPERSAFLVFVVGATVQNLYEALMFSPKASSRNHYTGDSTAFFNFSGAAIEQAQHVNLRSLSYIPDSTPQSVALTDQISENLDQFVHPYSVIAADAATVFNSISTSSNEPLAQNMTENLNNTFGITGPLVVDMNGDRVAGSYVWFRYTVEAWLPDFTLGRNLLYGDYAGPFVSL